jgi:hypothetical protein
LLKPKKHRQQKNQPVFDLAAELQRTMGVDLTAIDGVDVMIRQVILSELGPDFCFAQPSAPRAELERAPRVDAREEKREINVITSWEKLIPSGKYSMNR